MTDAQETSGAVRDDANGSMALFWGCFIALIATSFAFISRMYLCDVRFPTDFGIEKVTVGALKGAGVWPFAVSIILFSLVIDRIGYRTAMFFSFGCYVVYMILACLAYAAIQDVPADQLKAAQLTGYNYLYWGSIILGLGNGTVEAFINPVVATMFSREKTKWLNILHAGWPGGLVIGGIITIAMADVAKNGDWRLVLGTIAIPAVIYFLMLFNAKFPVSEREQAGVSYREMLSEFGAFGALVGFGLIFMQFGEVFQWHFAVTAILTAIVAIGFGAYTQNLGRGILSFLIIIMMPLATTEIGTDGWIMGLMEKPMDAAGYNPGWVLVYTSAIMMVLRFFAGPIVHRLFSDRIADRQFGVGHRRTLCLVKDGDIRNCRDLCRRHAVWIRQDILLANNARSHGRTVPERRCTDIECDLRDWNDRSRCSWLPIYRSAAGTDGECRTRGYISICGRIRSHRQDISRNGLQGD